tara:strand:+ start:257 stop:580 length:324 start_codon:yes stop_codon:yes gene_type:complete
MPTLNEYLLMGGLLFVIGLCGVMIRSNIIVILMSLEMMLSAANLTLVAFWRFGGGGGLPAHSYNAQVMVFFVITVAAAEVAVGLAIIVALFRSRQTVEVEELRSMKG